MYVLMPSMHEAKLSAMNLKNIKYCNSHQNKDVKVKIR